jgi:hypothetical protein
MGSGPLGGLDEAQKKKKCFQQNFGIVTSFASNHFVSSNDQSDKIFTTLTYDCSLMNCTLRTARGYARKDNLLPYLAVVNCKV